MFDLTTILAAGFALGLLHSFEPDHLAALPTLVGRTPQGARGDFWKGAAWALGHARQGHGALLEGQAVAGLEVFQGPASGRFSLCD
jgi:hypothetical protein